MHGGIQRDDRRQLLHPAQAVLRDRDAESRRIPRHVSASGSAAGPFSHAADDGLSGSGDGEAHSGKPCGGQSADIAKACAGGVGSSALPGTCANRLCFSAIPRLSGDADQQDAQPSRLRLRLLAARHARPDLAVFVLAHRMPLRLQSRSEWSTSAKALEDILSQMPMSRWES